MKDTLKSLERKREKYEFYARLTAFAEISDNSDGKSLLVQLQERLEIEKNIVNLDNKSKEIKDDIDNLIALRKVATYNQKTYELILNEDTLQTVGIALAEVSEKLAQYDKDQNTLNESQQTNSLEIAAQKELLKTLNVMIASKIDSIAELLSEDDDFEDNQLDEAKKFLDSKKVTTKKSSDWKRDADLECSNIKGLKSEIDTLNATLNKYKADQATKNTEKNHIDQKLTRLRGNVVSHKGELTKIQDRTRGLETDKRQKEQELRDLSAYDFPDK